MFAAAALGALGVCAWRAWRRGLVVRVGVLGELSAPTMAVLALACLGVAYHLLAHAFHWGTLKAPMWIAGLVGAGASGLAIVMDAFEGRSSPDAGEGGEEGRR